MRVRAQVLFGALCWIAGAVGCARVVPKATADGGPDGVVGPDGSGAPDAPGGNDGMSEPPPKPKGPEICGNGLDDDGNGLVDEGCLCAPGTTQPCFPDSMHLDGIGTCKAGVQTCTGTNEFGYWGACVGAVTPAPELCDGLDNDCNGRVDDGCLCNPGDMRACYGGPTGTANVGTCREGSQVCVSGPGGVGSSWGACDHEVRPDVEICDGLDNDCNGTVDDGCACQAGQTRACYGGAPGTEGVGGCIGGTQRCVLKAAGGGSAWGTCDGQMLPQPEVCDGVDNDCDGVVDDGCKCTPGAKRTCYDGPPATRGVGPCTDGTQTCVAGAGGVGSDWGPCVGAILPGAETCNDIDDDCDGTIDDGCACRRGDTKACYDGPSGTAGVGVCKAGVASCVITAGVASFGPCTGEVLPSAAGEVCNGLDDDCDGHVDGMARPCGSNVGQCRPGTETCTAGTWGACTGGVGPVTEICNGLDDNCDGRVDEGCDCIDGTTASCGPPEGNVGACKLGTKTCVGGHYGGCNGSVGPTSEICNGIDDDCDGVIDNGCTCVAGTTRPCYDGPTGTAGVGLCKNGTQTCVVAGGVASWGTCAGEVVPVPEICNGLDDDCNGHPDDGLTTPEQVVVPTLANREADILFMIDDSSSMNATQASLVANFPILMNTLRGFPGGLPDLHLAVVTSDLGAANVTAYGGCTPGGDGGNFHAPTPSATCQGPSDSYIIESNNEATKNYPGTIDNAFACIANVGSSGCGFEAQLASPAVALGFRGSIPARNAGFLRPEAFLAVAFITNEDDCSAPPDTPIFDPTSMYLADPYGPINSFRCNEFGHLCNGVKPPRVGTTPVTLTGCVSAEDGVLYKVSDLVAFFKSLKSDPSMLFMSAIAAPVNPYTIDYIPNPFRTTELEPNMAHSCTRSDGSYGDPAVRMAQFTAQFGANGSFSSICDDSYAPALTALGTAIGKGLTPHCLDAVVPDGDPTKPGIQASCQVTDHVPGADGGVVDTVITECDAASPSGGPQPCWYLIQNTTCTSGIQFAVNRAGPPATGETISIRCNPCGGT
jgi:hypothetical protein